MPHSPPWIPLRGLEGRQLPQHLVQPLQRQMANALAVVVPSLANPLDKCQCVVDSSLLTAGLPSHSARSCRSRYSTVVTGRERHAFSVKDQVSNFFSFAAHLVSIPTTQLWLWHESEHLQYINE